WGTYFGGSGIDIFYALHVDPFGYIYASGDSNSTSNVASPGAHQTVYGGGIDDAVFAKFNTNGQRMWSTYYGGTMHDISVTITVDSNKDVIFAGHTESTGAIATSGAYNTFFSAGYDVFVAKFDSSGVNKWGTYYGDTGTEEAFSVDVDASNTIYITGFTNSLFGISTGGAYQPINGGNTDAFIATFDATGSNLLYGTYYGGTGDDQGTAIKVANTGIIYITGNTTSPNNMSSPGAHQLSQGSSDDGFLACFTPAGLRSWGTYFGGNDVDYITGMLLDAANNIIFSGSTESTNAISTAGAYQPTLAVALNYDGYFAKFSPAGKQKLGTYFGGTNTDYAKGITMDNTGKIYIAGETQSTNAIASPGAYITTAPGSGDAYLAKFCMGPEPSVTPATTQTICIGSSFTLTTQSGFIYLWNTGATSNPLIVTASNPPGVYNYVVKATDAFGCDGFSDTSKVVFSVCTAIEELKGQSGLNIFPVPAGDYLTISFNSLTAGGQTTVDIFSALGMKLAGYEIKTSTLDIPVAGYAPGIYLLRITTNGTITEKKFIKQ
ncbi:MAG: T9SS type A sorting domain-containing protein, partial [Bacteroidia bacterium]